MTLAWVIMGLFVLAIVVVVVGAGWAWFRSSGWRGLAFYVLVWAVSAAVLLSLVWASHRLGWDA